jgi:Ca-activated chloride channel family protein
VKTTDDGPTGAVLYADIIVFNTESCTLEVRRQKDGALLWGRWLGDPLMSQPAVAHGKVVLCYPRSEAGNAVESGPVPEGTVVRGGIPVEGAGSHALAGFDLRTGRYLWARGVPGDCITAPVIEGGVVHAATLDGFLLSLDTGDPTLDGWPMWGGVPAHNGK